MMSWGRWVSADGGEARAHLVGRGLGVHLDGDAVQVAWVYRAGQAQRRRDGGGERQAGGGQEDNSVRQSAIVRSAEPFGRGSPSQGQRHVDRQSASSCARGLSRERYSARVSEPDWTYQQPRRPRL
ncbi:hypothetical protein B0H10DRAFT_2077374 [Mycena sp. CBHHK59/15]|nr:hypothetical protein B0H10DRAFT_2077374 [Mycena sp. CBHHK59/15]